MSAAALRLKTPAGRWAVAATVLGSGAVFLEGTVTNVALPTIGSDFGLRMSGLQWVVNAYMLPLSALILLGGSLGDRYGRRRVFVLGLGGFAAASALCMLAPSFGLLLLCRFLQGTFGALLVPNSLALLDTLFHGEDPGTAIGAGRASRPRSARWLAGGWSTRWHGAGYLPAWFRSPWRPRGSRRGTFRRRTMRPRPVSTTGGPCW